MIMVRMMEENDIFPPESKYLFTKFGPAEYASIVPLVPDLSLDPFESIIVGCFRHLSYPSLEQKAETSQKLFYNHPDLHKHYADAHQRPGPGVQ